MCLNRFNRTRVERRITFMKSFLLGTLSLALTMPAFAGTPSVSSAAGEKFGASAHLNYTAVVRGAPRAGYRPGYGYRGYPYHGGYYGHRYPYYGYRYPYYWGGGYWGGYYGYPYAAAIGIGLGLPLAYSAGYYAGAAPYGYGYSYPQGYYNGRIVADYQPGPTGPGGYSTRSSAARSVQTALQARGYYNGPIDGEFGPQSQQALAQFQQANGLKVTGLINSSSLKALDVK